MCCGITWRRVLKEFLRWRIPDYLIIIILAVVAAVIGKLVSPTCRTFDWDDPTISHPFDESEDFPMYSVAIAVVLVALVYFAGELVTRWNRSAGKLSMCLHINAWVLAHAYSILLAFAFVNITKLYAGRLRPDFLARLAKKGITKTTYQSFTPEEICKATKEGRLSFPSGHSGTIFSGYVPPTLYLLGLFRTLRGGRYWLATLALIPLILPITVAVSRTRDYRHNFDDIVTGSLCGTFCALFAVFINFTVSDKGEWTMREAPVNDRDEDFVAVASRPPSSSSAAAAPRLPPSKSGPYTASSRATVVDRQVSDDTTKIDMTERTTRNGSGDEPDRDSSFLYEGRRGTDATVIAFDQPFNDRS